MKIADAHLWVHAQDEALAFYTQKLGMEVRSDVTVPELGMFRWLTVAPFGQPDVAIALMAIPGPPVFEPETSEQVRSLMSKGAAGTVFLTSDDVRLEYEELSRRRLQFTDPPEERPSRIDPLFPDPSRHPLWLT